MDRLPIIAHRVTIMFESGKIALSQAPSLLNSSARPCKNNAREIHIIIENRMHKNSKPCIIRLTWEEERPTKVMG